MVSQVPDAESPAAQRPQSTGKCHLKALTRHRAQGVNIGAWWHQHSGHRHRTSGRVTGKKIQGAGAAPALHSGMYRLGELPVALEDLVKPLLEQQAQRCGQASHQALWRSAAKFPVRQIAFSAHPIPVKAGRRVGACHGQGRCIDGYKTNARRAHQPFLRGSQHNIGAQCVHGKGCGAQRGHHINYKQRRVARGIDGGAQRSQVGANAAGGIGVHHKHGPNLMLMVLAQGLRHSRSVNRQAFNPRGAQHAPPQRLGLYGPRLREMPGAGHQCCTA